MGKLSAFPPAFVKHNELICPTNEPFPKESLGSDQNLMRQFFPDILRNYLII
jgi:hypothetical protein